MISLGVYIITIVVVALLSYAAGFNASQSAIRLQQNNDQRLNEIFDDYQQANEE